MLERFSNKCSNCEISSDSGLIYRICADSSCSEEVTNSTRMLDSTLYFLVTYEGHEYNYQKTIVDVQLYQNGFLVNSTADNYNLTYSLIGTNQARVIGLLLDKEGSYNYEVRVRYYDPDSVTNSSTRIL